MEQDTNSIILERIDEDKKALKQVSILQEKLYRERGCRNGKTPWLSEQDGDR